MEADLGFMRIIFGRKRSIETEVGEDVSLVAGSSMANPDDLVGRKGLETYAAMGNDAQVKACMAIKKGAVLSRGWEIRPIASDGSRGKSVAEFCRWALEDMDGSVLTVLWNVCDALTMGYSLQNLVWHEIPSGPWVGKWAPLFIKSKDPTEWSFEVDGYRNVVAVKHEPTQEVIPRNRFVIYAYNPSYSNPYGTSDLRACYRNWWSKDFLTRFWNLYLEKYGSPTIKGTYKRGTPAAQQAELLRVLSSIQKNSAIVIPEDITAELLETIRQGDVGFRVAVEYHNREIAKSILNVTMVTDEGAQGIGSFAMAKVHLDVLRMCMKGMKLDLEQTVMKEQVLRPMVRLNFGVDVPVPDFNLGPLEDREIEPLSGAIKSLVECGVLDAKDPFIRDYLGLQGAGPAPDRLEVPSVTRTRIGTGPRDGNDGKVRVGV